MEKQLKARMPVPRIGLLPTGHKIYWEQFPDLKKLGMNMYQSYLKELVGTIGVDPLYKK